ncbi:phosphatidylglycerol lysyltransferase domain-containing protein [Chryseobacterium sp. SSA4.19]|uniref:phosphatidylglycerol lysyltransferase domain-containing protein n=1 Tax=Chryseobacterium sp. SSA4.19 TaxID=2919915 RepID=UPI001F4DE6F9|nr:phosphatidylglycerol lysyltransferase domain-containing protein [Chryseobacterium sp. SSA4.19]MCJ8154700.1 phosphatidylglycerol lysyltransferase domain-containing protein [Chryseobacterium sp. SSA4.19]
MKLSKVITFSRWKEVLAIVVLLLAFVFFRSERHELSAIGPQLKNSNIEWVFIGVLLVFVYVFLQGLMYVTSFKSVNLNIKLADSISLFLKRNLLSIFLPAGGVSSLAYLPRNIRIKGYKSSKIHQASAIYGFVSFLTVLIVGVPLIVYAVSVNKAFDNSWFGIISLSVLLVLLYGIFISFRRKNSLYRFIGKRFPKIISSADEIFNNEIDKKYFWYTVAVSIAIEFCGVFHLLIAMYAFGVEASFTAAAISYVISILLMIVSPFLRGLGAVEFSLTYILANFGYHHTEALGITLLYRFFEFWLPLILGVIAYLWSGRKLFARLLPVMMIFFLGIINILSVITPALANRLSIVKSYLSQDFIHISKMFTLLSGVLLLITSANLFKGSKRAWYFALILTISSVIFNLIKALDYEEALFALFTFGLLIYSRKEYAFRVNRTSLQNGFSWFLGIFVSIFIFNYLSFYFIDPSHFRIDFTKTEALYYTLQTFLLFKNSGLTSHTGFARDFQQLNHILGVVSWLVLIFSFYRTNKLIEQSDMQDRDDAESLVEEYGVSSLDYFKLTSDKKLFFAENRESFLAYRIANGFAVILESPVCEEGDKISLIEEFEEYCKNNSLKTTYYRVGEAELNYFKPFRKKQLFIGQDAILDTEKFSLSGKDKKSIRNGINTLEKSGFTTEIKYAPHKDEILDKAELVSNEWLKEFDKKEIVFAEGMFEREVLKEQDLIVISNAEGNYVAFLNIIPHCAPDECSYDMIRKTADAPNGSIDALIVKLVEYAKGKELQFINMGMTPMAGLDEPNNTAEEILKFAYQRVGSFKHYQTLRNFKEKYADLWENKYLIYNNDLELLQIPTALNKVMKP